jgi:divalent metal cation (Fe/Co/Zn/Cd) transporter
VFAVIGIAIVIDVSRTVVSYRSARVYRSAALRSNAFHFGGDLLGTVAVLIGLLFARSGYGRADAIAALVVAAIIAAAATRLTLENVRSLMDQALPESEAIVRRAIEGLNVPVAVELTRLREAGGQHFVELVATVPPAAAVSEAHILSDAIEQAVEQALPGSDVIVHVEPARSDADLHERVLGAALSVGSVREVHNLAVVDLGDGLEASLHLKFPADVALTEAHADATRVESAIRDAAPEILAVHTHLEPIKEAITGSGQNLDDDDLLDAGEQEIRRILLDETPPPRQLHVFRTAHGLVVHATLVVGDATLQEAHSRATELEGRIRATDAHIHDIVIHTEP